MYELTGRNHRCCAQFKCAQTIGGLRFARNGPNGVSDYYYYYVYYCYYVYYYYYYYYQRIVTGTEKLRTKIKGRRIFQSILLNNNKLV